MTPNKYAAKAFSIISFLFVFIFLANPVCAQGKKRGKVTTKHVNGVKASQGKVKHYKKEGEWKYWDDDGKLVKTINYKHDIEEGLYTAYYPSGQKSEEGNYTLGKKDGAWNTWYNDGKFSSKLNYDVLISAHEMKSSYEGLQQWYYENGQLREESSYVNHQLISRRTFYYSGKKKAIEYYKDEKPTGTWRMYNEFSTDSLPAFMDNYAGGKKEGLHLAYRNGRLSEEWNYKNGQLDGSVKTWDANGSLSILENYENGKREGLCRYFNFGKCIREATYHLGKINGEEKEYDSQERLFRQTWYKSGRPDSAFTFHKNGKMATSRIYKYIVGFVSTEEFSEYKEWDENGILLLHGSYHFEQKDHDWTTYYPDGKVKSVTPYSNGAMSGLYKKWYSNGKQMIEMNVEGHYANGMPKVWTESGKPVKPGTKYYDEIVDSSKPGEIYNDPKQVRHDRINFTPPEINDMDEAGPDIITPTVDAEQEQVFSFAEKMPEFPGGPGAQQEFVSKNIKYPEIEKEAGKQGTVYLTFIVEKDGSISNIKEAKGIAGAPGLTKEAIRVVSQMPKWTPGTMNGRAVRVSMTIPVRFVLN